MPKFLIYRRAISFYQGYTYMAYTVCHFVTGFRVLLPLDILPICTFCNCSLCNWLEVFRWSLLWWIYTFYEVFILHLYQRVFCKGTIFFSVTSCTFLQVKATCICDVRMFPFQKLPKHVQEIKVYTWKPIVIQVCFIKCCACLLKLKLCLSCTLSNLDLNFQFTLCMHIQCPYFFNSRLKPWIYL